MKTHLAPQQKKQMSYAKDRRNIYGERGANSRFAIRNSKNFLERRRRHAENQTLRGIIHAQGEDQIVALENGVKSLPARKKKFHKMPDAPLSEVIAWKLEYREFMGMGTKTKKPPRKAKINA